MLLAVNVVAVVSLRAARCAVGNGAQQSQRAVAGAVGQIGEQAGSFAVPGFAPGVESPRAVAHHPHLAHVDAGVVVGGLPESQLAGAFEQDVVMFR